MTTNQKGTTTVDINQLRDHLRTEHKLARSGQWQDYLVREQHQLDHRDPSQWTHDHDAAGNAVPNTPKEA